MALGKIKADTLEHSTAGSLDTSYVVNGSAKAWASFNQTSTGHPVYDSFNVSGTSDIGAGATKVSFSNAMSNANYSTSGGGQTDGFDATTFGLVGKRTTNSEQMKTTDFTTNNRNQAGSDYDTEYVGSVVHGDLA